MACIQATPGHIASMPLMNDHCRLRLPPNSASDCTQFPAWCTPAPALLVRNRVFTIWPPLGAERARSNGALAFISVVPHWLGRFPLSPCQKLMRSLWVGPYVLVATSEAQHVRSVV